MKQRVICGSAAIVLTGLTGTMFTTAAPHARDLCVTPTVLPAVDTAASTIIVDGVRYAVTTAAVLSFAE